MKPVTQLFVVFALTFASIAYAHHDQGDWKTKPLNSAETACFTTAGVDPTPATKGAIEAAKKGVADATAKKQLEKCLREANKDEHKHH